jgi:glucose/arabinose dehydrogenase
MTYRARRWLTLLTLVATLSSMSGCYRMRPSQGGGQTAVPPTRSIRSADVALPSEYRIDAVATGLTFPTSVILDDRGIPYVVEAGYSYGEAWTTPKLLRVEPDGRTTVIASGGRNGPWSGGSFANGTFFVAEGGELEGGRILRITPDGGVRPIVADLPSFGDHHTNGAVAGPDGAIYFGQGTATNSGVVGEDNFQFGWAKRHPDFHDTPCRDVTLSGQNFQADNPLNQANRRRPVRSPRSARRRPRGR